MEVVVDNKEYVGGSEGAMEWDKEEWLLMRRVCGVDDGAAVGFCHSFWLSPNGQNDQHHNLPQDNQINPHLPLIHRVNLFSFHFHPFIQRIHTQTRPKI